MIHRKYEVEDSTVFEIAHYPEMAEELQACKERLNTSSWPFGSDMVISYNKDHKLKKVWVEDHGDFVDRLLTYFGKNTHTASLFAAGKGNTAFITGLEAHIKKQLL